jgi:hypothetical protein
MKTLKKQYKELKKQNSECISFNHFLAYNLINYKDIERLFLPVFMYDKKVQFTN